MDFFFFLLAIVLLTGPVLGIVAFFQARRLRTDLRRQGQEIAALRTILVPEPSPAEEIATPADIGPAEVTPPPPLPEESDPEPAIAAEQSPAPVADFETRLAQRWMVWAGGVVLLGAVILFFTYAIDQGWLSPAVRVALGLLAGTGLIVAGAAARRKADLDPTETDSPRAPNFVPAALTGAGLFALFASLFVAHAVLGLIPSAIAFALLGAVGFLGLALSVRHGWLVAALGLVAAYGTPFAIDTAGATPGLPFFLYLFALNAAVGWLCSGRNWVWIARPAWAMGFGWAFVATLGADPAGADQLIIGLYLVATAVLGVLFPKGGSVPMPRPLLRLWPELPDIRLDWIVAGAILLALSPMGNWSAASSIALWSFAVMGLVCGTRFPGGLWIAAPAAATGVLATLLWPDPLALTRGTQWLDNLSGDSLGATALWFALVFGLGGFPLARRGSGSWAALSVVTALASLSAVYFRYTVALSVAQDPLTGTRSWALFASNPPWAVAFLCLAALFLGAATILVRSQSKEGPVAAYAAGVTGAAALALAITFDGAWLTLALAAEVAALGWIWSRSRVASLKPIAGLLSLVVMGTMANGLPPIDDPLSVGFTVSAALRGLVVPTLLLRVAIRLFALDREETNSGPLTRIIASVFLALTAVVGALTLDALIGASGIEWLREWKLAAVALWVMGLGAWAFRAAGARTAWDGAPIGPALIGIGLFIGPVLEGIANNPFFSERALGGWPVFNALGLAYLAPALLCLALLLPGRFRVPAEGRPALPWIAGVLGLVYLTFETLRTVEGVTVLRLGDITEPGLYAVSIVWIAMAFGLLALGLRTPRSAWLAELATPERRKTVRLTALGLLTAAACKLFILDMAGLSGLWRIASFVGLGASLIGVGEIYRRVMRPSP